MTAYTRTVQLDQPLAAGDSLVITVKAPAIPATPPPPPPPTTALVGFGSKATGGTGKPDVHVTTLADSGPGSYRAAWGSDRNIVFDVEGEIVLLSTVAPRGLSNFTVDATGKAVTIVGYGTDIGGCKNFILRNLAGRKINPIQYASCFTIRDSSSNWYIENLSADGYSHRALDIYTSCADGTVRKTILGIKGPKGLSNYPMLVGKLSQRVSLYECLLIGGGTRMPQADYDNNDGKGPVPTEVTLDIANCVLWSTDPAYYSLLTVHGNSKVNIRNSFLYGPVAPGENHAVHGETGALIYTEGLIGKDGTNVQASPAFRSATPFPVAPYAVLPLAPTLDAVKTVLADAGRKPRDPVDAAYVSSVAL